RIHKSLGTLENIVQFLEMVRRYTDLLIRVCAFLGKLPNDALRQAPNSNAIRIDAAPIDTGSGDKPAAAQRQDVTEQFRQSGVVAKSGIDFELTLFGGSVKVRAEFARLIPDAVNKFRLENKVAAIPSRKQSGQSLCFFANEVQVNPGGVGGDIQSYLHRFRLLGRSFAFDHNRQFMTAAGQLRRLSSELYRVEDRFKNTVFRTGELLSVDQV